MVDPFAAILLGRGRIYGGRALDPPDGVAKPTTNSRTNTQDTPNEVPPDPPPANQPPSTDPPQDNVEGDINLPVAQTIGDPPHGLDAEATANTVGDSVIAGIALDEANLPIGWNPDTGEPIIGDIGDPGFGGDPTGGDVDPGGAGEIGFG